MTKIIAFAGTKQSGKTTCSEAVADFFNTAVLKYNLELVDNFNKATIYNFADPLKKDVCINILGLTYDQCYGTDEQKNELVNCYWQNEQLTARQVMQFVGTDIFRKMQQNVWADATILKIQKEKQPLAIIADCRFPNEVDAVKNAGGLVIRLTRKPFDSDHSSEIALEPQNYDWSNFDFVLHNASMTIHEQKNAIIGYLQNRGILPL
jgi:hypothetical protein